MHEEHFSAAGHFFPAACCGDTAGTWIDVRAAIAAVVEWQPGSMVDLVSHFWG